MNGLTLHQMEQLEIALSSRVGILTGSAGTGKSHTVARYLESLSGGFAVAAPTGKAASRINQESDFGARTIHGILLPDRNGHDGDGWSFQYGLSQKLPYSVIVVDEAFMVSADLMASMLNAVREGSRVLFVGDPNQLPPVGHGRPVYDMMQSGIIPRGHLSEIHRFAGRIARVANAIKDGQAWLPSEAIDLDAKPVENMRHVECKSAALTVAALKEICGRMSVRGYDPIDDIQIICALNDRGQVSRKELNRFLQESLNPDGDRAEKIPFRIGDKVICLRNQLRDVVDEDADKLDEPKVYLANGETGRVVGWVRNKKRIPVGVIVRILGQLVAISAGGFNDFDLAYAVTVHKFQGSQAKVVIVVVDDGAGRVAHRSWVYTAITRAAELCFTVGKMSTLRQQCRHVDITERQTFLSERIQRWGFSKVFEDDPELALI